MESNHTSEISLDNWNLEDWSSCWYSICSRNWNWSNYTMQST